MQIAAVVVAVVVVVALCIAVPAIAAVFGSILVLGSIAVFLWAAVGLAVPHKVGLSDRGHAVGMWMVSVVMLIVGAVLQPDNERTRPDGSAAAVEAMEEPEPEPATAADA